MNYPITQISRELKISHSAVSQWFSGKTKPTVNSVIFLNERYKIPLFAWKDIKTFLTTNESLSESEKKLKSTKRKNSTKEETC